MKNTVKVLGLAAIIAAIAFNALMLTGCPPPEPEGPALKEIKVTGPTKTTYITGETFDRNSIVVTAYYDDDTTETVTDYDISGFDSTTIGKKTVIVTYKDKTASFEVTVAVPTPFDTAPALSLAADNAKLTYTWAASVPAADSYDVYWKAGNGLAATDVKTGTKITGATSGGSITGLTNGTAYSVLVTANKAGYTSSDSAVQTATPADVVLYVITGSGTSFTAKKGGATVGTAGPIQDVINAIQTDANGADVTIQFGDGTAVLNAGEASVSFNNTGGTWGLVTLSGKISSAVNASNSGTIVIVGDVSVTSNADIANTVSAESNSSYAIYNNSTGVVKISSGTVSAIGGRALYINNGKIIVSGTAKVTSENRWNNLYGTIFISGNGSDERLIIEGGTVENTGAGTAIYNSSNCTVTISGGTVSALSGYAVYNNYAGKTTVSGTAKVTSAQTSTTYGTIFLSSGNTNTNERLVIEGGTVENTSTGCAINNNSTGAIIITGGTVTATTSYAVYNRSSGAVTISGGTVSATTGSAVRHYSVNKVTVSGTANIVSANPSTTQGTIHIGSSGTATDVRLEVTGGTVVNTTTTGYAIYNDSTGEVTVTSPPAVITGKQQLVKP